MQQLQLRFWLWHLAIQQIPISLMKRKATVAGIWMSWWTLWALAEVVLKSANNPQHLKLKLSCKQSSRVRVPEPNKYTIRGCENMLIGVPDLSQAATNYTWSIKIVRTYWKVGTNNSPTNIELHGRYGSAVQILWCNEINPERTLRTFKDTTA